jgi:hypothetical protein
MILGSYSSDWWLPIIKEHDYCNLPYTATKMIHRKGNLVALIISMYLSWYSLSNIINVQSLTKLSAFRMRVHWSYQCWRNIWYTLKLFSILFAHKKYSCIGMLSIAIFDIQRWRYLHITLDHILSCCVSPNGLAACPLAFFYYICEAVLATYTFMKAFGH